MNRAVNSVKVKDLAAIDPQHADQARQGLLL